MTKRQYTIFIIFVVLLITLYICLTHNDTQIDPTLNHSEIPGK